MTTENELQKETLPSEKLNPVNWKQAFAITFALAGVLLAGMGAYLTVKSIDREFETSSTVERTRIESVMALKKDSADSYGKEVKRNISRN